MKKNKEPEGTKVRRALPIKLSDAELAQKGKLAAQLNIKLAAAVEAKKEEVSKHTAGIKTLQNKITTHLACISDGFERREVQCLEVRNFEDNTVEYYYEGEVLETRPMTENDRQDKMPIKQPKPKVNPKRVARLPYKDDDHESREEQIAKVHKLESSRKTASSAVDPVKP